MENNLKTSNVTTGNTSTLNYPQTWSFLSDEQGWNSAEKKFVFLDDAVQVEPRQNSVTHFSKSFMK